MCVCVLWFAPITNYHGQHTNCVCVCVCWLPRSIRRSLVIQFRIDTAPVVDTKQTVALWRAAARVGALAVPRGIDGTQLAVVNGESTCCMSMTLVTCVIDSVVVVTTADQVSLLIQLIDCQWRSVGRCRYHWLVGAFRMQLLLFAILIHSKLSPCQQPPFGYDDDDCANI